MLQNDAVGYLRVIAGECKGRPLKVPERRATRPATELVRGAIFSMLANLTENWDEVLDLFSGSGSLGIEALSRGAGHADFVEQERVCCDILLNNLEQCGLADRARVHCLPVERAISFLDKTYDIILMDPPYRREDIGLFLGRLAGTSLIGDSTWLVITHSPRVTLDERYGQLVLYKERRHGDSVIAIYRKEAA
ncbi:16S rRNA (guanine(966)-N(2))-methyltransferase RsmD [Dehalogenimonas alkenigignens]|uniref:16S rRNA (Guanine(966)-N(2))-methyltransferase RsmD n=1 Tax=Dehalogenimonas alkenigignens TaxID=1217799 RepID=A0A0W0GKG3_9CHLR|nr:16S rRNA (guanine(966)-N(2))-methyltransferase RsmD [Dehalogenimonas alkenigignens]KTB49065.1 16S rRNA (guanine(966)-N(2))-methyltransferase RsmD [Dehalogenimonas alkenigignens]